MRERMTFAETWITNLKIKFKHYTKVQRGVLNKLEETKEIKCKEKEEKEEEEKKNKTEN